MITLLFTTSTSCSIVHSSAILHQSPLPPSYPMLLLHVTPQVDMIDGRLLLQKVEVWRLYFDIYAYLHTDGPHLVHVHMVI